ncbi:molecular chaperone TorD family protein [Halomonas sp. G15]|uniref:TorD/DmsD family molecular chaperone n=1 Tax=Halomonas sp. G15 TaxID=2903521 RepID=UPI001E3EC0C0|nr:molecular chaperone TorD family protein [Halomonas sp. G15]MCE0732088.1 molecular chaperone TorD family protein [Halomonas sp. G15]
MSQEMDQEVLATEAGPDEQEALRADLYRLLARLIREPVDDELLAWLARLELEDDVEENRDPVAAALARLSHAAGGATPSELERAHFRHLVGVVQGEITPYASWYRNGELMDQALVTLREDLRRLGFMRSESSHDPEDHLAALFEIMAMLIEDHAAETAAFFMSHLAPWTERCLDDLARVDTAFYARTGELGQAFIARERSQLAAEAERSPVKIIEP